MKVNLIADYSGHRTHLVSALKEGISQYHEVNVVDVHDVVETSDPLKQRHGITTSKWGIENDDVNVLIQTHQSWFNKAHLSKLIYLHIDGTRDITPAQVSYSIRTWAATGKHDYSCSTTKHTNIIPFVLPGFFNPNREKTTYIEETPRAISFEEYKDRLETSTFVWVWSFDQHPYQLGNGVLSKRVFEAMACKTIPVVITLHPEYYYRLGFDDDMLYFINPKLFPYGFDVSKPRIHYMRERGYKFVMKYHTIDNRMKKLNRIINRVGKRG